MLVAVALRNPRLFALHRQHLAFRQRNVRIGGDHLDGVGRLARANGAELLVDRLLLRPPGPRHHHVVVQLVQPDDDKILLLVEGHGILPLAIVGEAAFAFFHFALLLFQLPVEPLDHVLGRLELDLEILVHVLVDQRVRRCLRKFRVGRVEQHVDQLAAGDRLDVNPGNERVHQRRFRSRFSPRPRRRRIVRRRTNQRGDTGLEAAEQGERRHRRTGGSIELGQRRDAELPDDAAREIAPLEDSVLRLVVQLGIFVVVVGGHAGNGNRSLVFDEQPRLRAKQVHRAVVLNQDRGGREDEDGGGDAAIPVDHRQAVEDVNFTFGNVSQRRRRAFGCRASAGTMISHYCGQVGSPTFLTARMPAAAAPAATIPAVPAVLPSMPPLAAIGRVSTTDSVSPA